MKVENIIGKNGIAVKNQFIITDDDGNNSFQSYSTIIAKKDIKGNLTFDINNWNYSITTSKYRNIFTGLTTKETEKQIKTGLIRLENLN